MISEEPLIYIDLIILLNYMDCSSVLYRWYSKHGLPYITIKHLKLSTCDL